jgi:hypothetical protein
LEGTLSQIEKALSQELALSQN